MAATLSVLLMFSLVFVGECEGRTSQSIHPQEGEDVIFNCPVDPQRDLTGYSLDFKIVDDNFKTMNVDNDIVHKYSRGKDHPNSQMARYVNHTQLNHEDLRRGAVTLTMKSVQSDFSGNYKCYIPDLKAICTYTLTVGEKRGDLTTSRSPAKDPPTPHSSGVTTKFWFPIAAAAAAAAVIFTLSVSIIKCGACKKSGEATHQGNDIEMKTLEEGRKTVLHSRTES